MLSFCLPSPDVRRPAFSAPYKLCGRLPELEFRAGGSGGAADFACFAGKLVEASLDCVDSVESDVERAWVPEGSVAVDDGVGTVCFVEPCGRLGGGGAGAL